MTQPSPTPVPDHGTGWGLLMLFSLVYGIVVVLGAVTVLALAMRYFNKRFPKALEYLSLGLLVGALAVSVFTALVAARAQRFDVVGLFLVIVFLPLAYVITSRYGTERSRLAVATHAALAWSLPFVAGFGVIAFGGTQVSGVPPVVSGIVGAVIVLAGTIMAERRLFVPEIEQ